MAIPRRHGHVGQGNDRRATRGNCRVIHRQRIAGAKALRQSEWTLVLRNADGLSWLLMVQTTRTESPLQSLQSSYPFQGCPAVCGPPCLELESRDRCSEGFFNLEAGQCTDVCEAGCFESFVKTSLDKAPQLSLVHRAGRALQSGSRSAKTAARLSDGGVARERARGLSAIRDSTQPNAQMSVRLSTGSPAPAPGSCRRPSQESGPSCVARADDRRLRRQTGRAPASMPRSSASAAL